MNRSAATATGPIACIAVSLAVALLPGATIALSGAAVAQVPPSAAEAGSYKGLHAAAHAGNVAAIGCSR